MSYLDSARLKLRMAERHMGCLVVTLQAFMDLTLIPKWNQDRTVEKIYVRVEKGLPDEANSVFGDCIHNFRSVLDHIAMALAIKNGVDPDDTSVSFPVFQSRDQFYRVSDDGKPTRGSGMHKIRKVISLPGAQAFFERFQPFNRPEDCWVLSELEFFDNRDKHRTLNLQSYEAVTTIEPVCPPGVSLKVHNTPIKDGSHVATVIYSPSYQGENFYIKSFVAVGVERSDKATSIPVIPYLKDSVWPLIRDEILPEAEKLF